MSRLDCLMCCNRSHSHAVPALTPSAADSGTSAKRPGAGGAAFIANGCTNALGSPALEELRGGSWDTAGGYPRFLLDNMLSRTAKWLRNLGYLHHCTEVLTVWCARATVGHHLHCRATVLDASATVRSASPAVLYLALLNVWRCSMHFLLLCALSTC